MKSLKYYLLTSALLMSANSNALDCTGNVLSTRIMNTGTVELKIDGPVGGNYPDICSVRSTYYNVHPDTCKSWLSLALTAKASGKKVTLWGVSGGTCAEGGPLEISKISIVQ